MSDEPVPVRRAVVGCLAIVVVGFSIQIGKGHFGKLAQIGLATLATLVGVLQGMRGRTVATWARANSP